MPSPADMTEKMSDITEKMSDETVPPEVIARGTTRYENIWQSYIKMVEGEREKEANATRRHNIQVCLGFLKQHGYPAYGYNYMIHHGVLEVLTDEEDLERGQDEQLREIHPMSEAFGIVGCCWSLSRQLAIFIDVNQMYPIEENPKFE